MPNEFMERFYWYETELERAKQAKCHVYAAKLRTRIEEMTNDQRYETASNDKEEALEL